MNQVQILFNLRRGGKTEHWYFGGSHASYVPAVTCEINVKLMEKYLAELQKELSPFVGLYHETFSGVEISFTQKLSFQVAEKPELVVVRIEINMKGTCHAEASKHHIEIEKEVFECMRRALYNIKL